MRRRAIIALGIMVVLLAVGSPPPLLPPILRRHPPHPAPRPHRILGRLSSQPFHPTPVTPRPRKVPLPAFPVSTPRSAWALGPTRIHPGSAAACS